MPLPVGGMQDDAMMHARLHQLQARKCTAWEGCGHLNPSKLQGIGCRKKVEEHWKVRPELPRPGEGALPLPQGGLPQIPSAFELRSLADLAVLADAGGARLGEPEECGKVLDLRMENPAAKECGQFGPQAPRMCPQQQSTAEVGYCCAVMFAESGWGMPHV